MRAQVGRPAACDLTEMRQPQHRGRRPGLDRVERALPRGQVDLGWSRRRYRKPPGGISTADGVARVAGRRPSEERHVVRAWPGVGKTSSPATDRRGHGRWRPAPDDLAEEAVEVVCRRARRALRSRRLGSTRCGAPSSLTCTWRRGLRRTSAPAPPAVVGVDVGEQEVERRPREIDGRARGPASSKRRRNRPARSRRAPARRRRAARLR